MSHRALAVAILLGLTVAGVTFVEAHRMAFWSLLGTPAAGAYGTAWTDLPPPEIRAKAHAAAEALWAKAVWTERVSFACAGLSLAGILVAAWRNRRDVRSWHWLSFLGAAVLVATATLGYSVSLNRARRIGLLAMVALAFAACLLDLRRGKEGAPGRPVSWVTLLLSVVFAVVLLTGE